MQVENAVEPTEAQIMAFLGVGHEGPVHMVNLLRFKEKADYPDGRDAGLSGRDAYMRYGGPMIEMVTAAGGSLDFTASAHPLLVGQTEKDWDLVAIVTYPSAQKMVELATSEAFQAIAVHRKAGLEGQLLIPCWNG